MQTVFGVDLLFIIMGKIEKSKNVWVFENWVKGITNDFTIPMQRVDIFLSTSSLN